MNTKTSNANEPAFPQTATEVVYGRDIGAYPNTYSTGGLTKREHAAILLRVPRSGDADIDAIIREAIRRNAAEMAMQGYLSKGFQGSYTGQKLAEMSVEKADTLLAELERTA